jgi:hypothetical protein
MLASQAALCELTGSREMSVFQTLSAGNIGQRAAPGTLVPAGGLAGGAGDGRGDGLGDGLSGAAACTLIVAPR